MESKRVICHVLILFFAISCHGKMTEAEKTSREWQRREIIVSENIE
ncbi:MAG: hypothetical protein LBK58_04640 [Prevotellaceae bacterium]|jgi:hypothetical protein|nr:hypothetical protein [Prevotellaceae bacterium]